MNGKLCLKGRVHEKSRNSWSYHPKFILAAVWKGNSEGTRKEKNWNARSYHPKFIIEGFWMENWQEKDMRKAGIKLWKEHGMRKAGIHDLTIQSSQLQIFKWKSVKGKGNEKSRNLRLRSYHPKFIFCSCLKRKIWKKK